jgi:hypothetical protein
VLLRVARSKLGGEIPNKGIDILDSPSMEVAVAGRRIANPTGSSLKARDLLAALSECPGEARVEVLYDCGAAEGTVVGVEITPLAIMMAMSVPSSS